MTAEAAARAWKAFTDDLDEEASAWVEATYQAMAGLKAEKYNPYHDARGRFSDHGSAIFHSGLRPGSGSRVLPPEPPKPTPKPKPERKKPEPKPGATGKPTTGAEVRSRMGAIVNDEESKRLRAEVKKYDDQINRKYREAYDLRTGAEEAAIQGRTALHTRLSDQSTAKYAEINALQKERAVATNASIKYDKDAGQRVKEQLLYHDQPAKLGRPNMPPALKTAKGVNEGHAEFARLVGPGHVDGRSAYFRTLPDGSREYFSQYASAIHVSKNTTKHTTVHEMGHWLEENNRSLHQEAINFRNRRTAGEASVRMNDIKGHSGYDKTEVTKPDKFLHPYIGKSYPGNSATEVISMGLEYFSKDPIGMAKNDPDYFDFMFDALRSTAKPGSRKSIDLPGRWLTIYPGSGEKFNPYHDARGRFSSSSGSGAASSGLGPGSSPAQTPPEPEKPSPGVVQQPSTRRYATGAEARAAMDELLADTSEQKRLEADLQVAKKKQETAMEAAASAPTGDNKQAWQRAWDAVEESNQVNDALVNEQKRRAQAAREIVYHSEPAAFRVKMDSTFSQEERAKFEDGVEVFRRLVGPGFVDNKRIEIQATRGDKPVERSFFLSSQFGVKGGVFMDKRSGSDVVVHELGHWLEDQSTGVQADRRKFLDRRTGKSQATQNLRTLTGNQGYDDSEISKPDKFKNPYVGKVYPDRRVSEVISMGLQEMAKDPVKFAKDDPDYFDFIYNTIGKNAKRK